MKSTRSWTALGAAVAVNLMILGALNQGMVDAAQQVQASLAEPERVFVSARRLEPEFAQCPGSKTL
jgi:hypothetical protein